MMFSKSNFARLIVCGALLLLLAIPALCQVAPTGTIFGIVKDASGASIPKANVTVQDTESGSARTGTTGDDGAYRFAALPVGHYILKVVMTGFKTETQTGLTLDVAQEEAVNFTLQVGTTEQEVVVTGEASQVDTTTSSLGTLVSDNQVSDLPLNGRNFVDLTLLQPGTVQFQYNTFAANNLFGEFYSSNGAPIRSNMYTLDGAIMGNIQGASASSISGNSLGIDGIREYKVMTNTFSAEYGLAMGSQMTIVTKSGSNQFHGDAFEYLRNSSLDARNYFDALHTLPATTPDGGHRIAPFRRNQFGGSLGGPIKKDKTFFFATYEGLSELYDNPPNLGITPTMPAACHTPVINGVETVTSLCDPVLKGNATENIAPVMQPFVALWPLPNIEPGDQFTYLASELNHEHHGQARVDHNISASDTLFGRYTVDNDVENYPTIFPYSTRLLSERQQYVTIAESHIFTTNLLNSARVSYSRAKQIVNSGTSSQSPVANLTAPQYSFTNGLPCGGINISPLANFGTCGGTGLATSFTQNVFSFGDDVFWTKGKHAFKFGTLINNFGQYSNPPQLSAGSTAWASLHNFLLGLDRSYSVSLPSPFPQKEILYDTVGFYIQDDYRVLRRLTLNLGLRYEFATQENDKQGRQAYFANPPYSNAFTPGPLVENPTYRDVSPRFGFAWDIFGDGKTSLRGGFAILYDISQGQVFMGGTVPPPFAGASFTVTNSTSSPQVLVLPLQLPAGASLPGTLAAGTSPTAVQNNYESPHMLDFNLDAERQLPFDMALSVAFAASRGLNLWQVSGDEQNPFCPTTNTFVPQGCAGFTTVVPNANPTWLCPTPAGSPNSCPAGLAAAPRLNPFFANFNEFRAEGESWYNALEVNLKKRVGHGLEFQSAYTYSRAYDDTEGLQNSDTSFASTGIIENPFNNKLEWGPSNFDTRQNWHFNTLYHFPTINATGFVDKIANGWWIGNIIAVQTGLAFTPILSSDREQAGIAGSLGGWERPDYVTAANIAAVTAAAVASGVTTCPANSTSCIPYNPVIFNPNTVYTHTVGQWFNPNMFAIQPVGTIGDVSRNILREPGLTNLDLSLSKDTSVRALGEGGKVQFRAEIFNILNHANFGPSGNAIFSGGVKDNAGFTAAQTLAAQGFAAENPSITSLISTSTNARQIQFSLKVVF